MLFLYYMILNNRFSAVWLRTNALPLLLKFMKNCFCIVKIWDFKNMDVNYLQVVTITRRVVPISYLKFSIFPLKHDLLWNVVASEFLRKGGGIFFTSDGGLLASNFVLFVLDCLGASTFRIGLLGDMLNISKYEK